MTDAATEHLVEEVRGPALTLVQAWSMIGMGVLALLSTGVISALLGALAFLRAIPVLMLIFWVYFLLPIAFGLDVPELLTVVLALAWAPSA